MQKNKLDELVLDALKDLKAIDINIIDVRELTDITDTMIVCSGSSTRHVKSIAENIIKKAKENKLSYIHSEGLSDGEWVVVDLADIIIHIMLPDTRNFYQLEDLWEPVKQLRQRKK